jgi:GTP pyrophosphokinase
MHQRAEYGVAAHWKYKSQSPKADNNNDEDLIWLKHLSDWQAETQDPSDFLDALRFEIGAKEVYVFTPKGRVIGLSTGATPVDFAYAVHTEVGHRTMGAKVNGRLVPLDTKLHSGDVVEIFTSKSQDASPSQDWLNFVTSARAKSKIRQWISQGRREDAVEAGKEQLAKAMRKQ